MTKAQAELVASEMTQAGFVAKTNGNDAEIGLTSRKVSRMEVAHALDQAFGGIEFNLTSTSNGVTVA